MTVWTWLSRDVLSVRGADAADYLQGQLSQDVAALAVGDAAWSFLLEPQGQVVAWLRLARIADDAFVLDVDAGHGEAVTARLERFKLRVDATIEVLEWAVLRVIDPGESLELVSPDPGFLHRTPWGDTVVVDLVGPTIEAPSSDESTAEDYEMARISAGVPRLGPDIEPGSLPAASGQIDRSVSFTKGCYTGQELVARVDSRGNNVPSRLAKIVAPGPLSVGDELHDDEGPAGSITSASQSVALALVKRRVTTPTSLTVDGVAVEVLSLDPAAG